MRLVTLRKAILTSILSAVSPAILLAQTATIHLSLLDERTGKSLSGMHLAFVDYYADRDGTTHADLNGRTTVTISPDGDLYILQAQTLMGFWSLAGWVMMAIGYRVLGKNFTIATREHTELSIFIRFLQSSVQVWWRRIAAAKRPLLPSLANSLFSFAIQRHGKDSYGA